MEEALALTGFWRTAGPERWFAKDAAFDAAFRDRFLGTHMAAAARQRDHWLDAPEGALALLLVLDQFPRNAFRGTAHQFATDPLARTFAAAAIDRGHDARVEPALRAFVYLPFEHSEDPADQQRSLDLFQPLGGEALDYARLHHQIIARFGRFPHRNPLLGRTTTPAEADWLKDGGFAG